MKWFTLGLLVPFVVALALFVWITSEWYGLTPFVVLLVVGLGVYALRRANKDNWRVDK